MKNIANKNISRFFYIVIILSIFIFSYISLEDYKSNKLLPETESNQTEQVDDKLNDNPDKNLEEAPKEPSPSEKLLSDRKSVV